MTSDRVRSEAVPATPPKTPPPSWLALATSGPVVRRGLGYAVVVGSVLIAINHGDAILAGTVDASRALRMGLTVLVPYVVSTLSSVGALRQR